MSRSGRRLSRRRVLGAGAAALLGAGPGSAGVARATAGEAPRIRRLVRLGRTDMQVSDVSFGSSRSADPDLVRHALDRGVNYFDTADSYRYGFSEKAMGEGLAGVRDRVFLASKTKARAGDTRADMMLALEHSLRRLRTDYLDVYFNHAVNDVDRMRNAEWAEFTEIARRQGKIRFRGMSGHGSRLVECLDYALERDLVDVILVAYNFSQDPDLYERLRHTFHYVAIQSDLPRVLRRAKAADVGVVAMKTLMGARLNDMRPHEHGGATFAQAAFRWVLSGGLADALIVSMTSREDIDEFVAGSGAPRVTREDRVLLERYAALQHRRYCRPGCRACEGHCPAGVAIAEVLRTRMYAVDYGDAAMARGDYARLEDGAAACATCVDAPCTAACPHGLPVARLTRDAARRLG